jgi:hypothetical protein
MASFFRPLLIIFGSCLLVACGYGDGDSHHEHRFDGDYWDSDNLYGSCGDAEAAIIDTDRQLEVEPGVGAGAFIEYEAGGTYRISTACDTATYGEECSWDIVVSLLDGAELVSMAPLDLELDDTLLFGEAGSVRLLTLTGEDSDGFTLQTEPGASIRFDALLDDGCAERFIFWVGDDALHNGAPSSVLDLTPSEP